MLLDLKIFQSELIDACATGSLAILRSLLQAAVLWLIAKRLGPESHALGSLMNTEAIKPMISQGILHLHAIDCGNTQTILHLAQNTQPEVDGLDPESILVLMIKGGLPSQAAHKLLLHYSGSKNIKKGLTSDCKFLASLKKLEVDPQELVFDERCALWRAHSLGYTRAFKELATAKLQHYERPFRIMQHPERSQDGQEMIVCLVRGVAAALINSMHDIIEEMGPFLASPQVHHCLLPSLRTVPLKSIKIFFTVCARYGKEVDPDIDLVQHAIEAGDIERAFLLAGPPSKSFNSAISKGNLQILQFLTDNVHYYAHEPEQKINLILKNSMAFAEQSRLFHAILPIMFNSKSGLVVRLCPSNLADLLAKYAQNLDLNTQWNLFVFLERKIREESSLEEIHIGSQYVRDILHARYALQLVHAFYELPGDICMAMLAAMFQVPTKDSQKPRMLSE